MSRNSEHLSSVYNSNMRLRLELTECRLRVSNVINVEIAVLVLEMLLKECKTNQSWCRRLGRRGAREYGKGLQTLS